MDSALHCEPSSPNRDKPKTPPLNVHPTNMEPDGAPQGDIGQQCKRIASLRLISEFTARQVLARGMPPLAGAGKVCDRHTAEYQNDSMSRDSTLLRDRALMPLCYQCVMKKLEGFTKNLDGSLPHIDTCCCAADIVEIGTCAYCNYESISVRVAQYVVTNAGEMDKYDDGTITVKLNCICGQPPMEKEGVRLCAGCDGIVTVPLHALDGHKHLCCPFRRPSWMPYDEIEKTPSLLEAQLRGSSKVCRQHPVRPVGSRAALIQIDCIKQLVAETNRRQDVERAQSRPGLPGTAVMQSSLPSLTKNPSPTSPGRQPFSGQEPSSCPSIDSMLVDPPHLASSQAPQLSPDQDLMNRPLSESMFMTPLRPASSRDPTHPTFASPVPRAPEAIMQRSPARALRKATPGPISPRPTTGHTSPIQPQTPSQQTEEASSAPLPSTGQRSSPQQYGRMYPCPTYSPTQQFSPHQPGEAFHSPFLPASQQYSPQQPGEIFRSPLDFANWVFSPQQPREATGSLSQPSRQPFSPQQPGVALSSIFQPPNQPSNQPSNQNFSPHQRTEEPSSPHIPTGTPRRPGETFSSLFPPSNQPFSAQNPREELPSPYRPTGSQFFPQQQCGALSSLSQPSHLPFFPPQPRAEPGSFTQSLHLPARRAVLSPSSPRSFPAARGSLLDGGQGGLEAPQGLGLQLTGDEAADAAADEAGEYGGFSFADFVNDDGEEEEEEDEEAEEEGPAGEDGEGGGFSFASFVTDGEGEEEIAEEAVVDYQASQHWGHGFADEQDAQADDERADWGEELQAREELGHAGKLQELPQQQEHADSGEDSGEDHRPCSPLPAASEEPDQQASPRDPDSEAHLIVPTQTLPQDLALSAPATAFAAGEAFGGEPVRGEAEEAAEAEDAAEQEAGPARTWMMRLDRWRIW